MCAHVCVLRGVSVFVYLCVYVCWGSDCECVIIGVCFGVLKIGV